MSKINSFSSRDQSTCVLKVSFFHNVDGLVAVEEEVHMFDWHIFRCNVHNERTTRAAFVKMWQAAMEGRGMPKDYIPLFYSTSYRGESLSFGSKSKLFVIGLKQMRR